MTLEGATADLDSRTLRLVRGLTYAWVVGVVLLLYPYTGNPAAPIKTLFGGWVLVLMALAWLVGSVRERLSLRITGGTWLLLATFVAWHVLCALLSEQPRYSLDSLRLWLGGLLLALFVGNAFRTPEQLWRLMEVIVAAAAVSSIYGFMQRFGLDPFPWSARNVEEYLGLPSTYANPNFAGHTLLLAGLMAAGLVIFRRSKTAAVALLLIAAHGYLTHMRGARVALLAALALLGLYVLLRRVLPRPAHAAIAAVTLGAVLAAAGMSGLMAYGILKAPSPLLLDAPFVLRLNGYHGAADMAATKPYIGYGPGMFELLSPANWTALEQRWNALDGKKNDHVHNDLLEAAAEAGFPGAGLYVALLLWGILAGLTLAGSKDTARARLGLVIAGCIAAFAVDGLFGFNLRVPVSAGVFFLLFAMLDALTQTTPPWRWWQVPVQLAVIIATVVLAVGNTASFYAESRLQEARGASDYADAHRDNPELRERALRAGLDALARGAAWAPFNPRFPALMGAFHAALNENKEAYAAFEIAEKGDTVNPAIHAAMAKACLVLALEREALVGTSTKPDPELTALLDSAERSARAAMEHGAPLAVPNAVLGRVAFLRAHYEADRRLPLLTSAQRELELALQRGTTEWTDIAALLAQVRAERDNPDGAEEAYARGAEKADADPLFWDAFEAFALAQQRVGAYVETLGKRAAQLDGEVQDALYLRMAQQYVGTLSNPAIASLLAQRVLRRNPASTEAWGLAATAQGEISTARLKSMLDTPMESGTPLGAGAPEWLRTVADAPTGEGFVAAAGQALQAARDSAVAGSTDTALAREFAWVARVLEHDASAAGLAPVEEGQAFASIAELYMLGAQWAECEGAAARALPLLPADQAAGTRLAHARALGALGRHAEALAEARLAASLAPGLTRIRAVLARELAANGRAAEARFEYTDLLKRLKPGANEYAEVYRDALAAGVAVPPMVGAR